MERKPPAPLTLGARLAAPVDIASLAVFRIAFGLLMVVHVGTYFATGQLERQYLTPVFFFKFTGFEWVRPGPPWLMIGVFCGLALAAFFIALGFFYRGSCALFCLGFTYVFLLDEADYQNHLYLIALLAALLTFLPAHRAFSLDVLRKPALRARTVPAWTLWILRFQVAIPYVFGGLAKLNYDWLVRAQPMKLWLQAGPEGGLQLALLQREWAAYLMSWAGAGYDLLVVPALLWRRTRIAAVAATLLFHLLNSELFTIGIFPWLMLAATTLFFPPDWPRWLGLRLRQPKAAPAEGSESGPPRHLPRPIAAALAVWVALQLLLPLRHLLYPGKVDWTEECHQFSWRMKLRDKVGTVRFVAVDPSSGRRYPLEGLDAALTARQRLMMEHDPDMIRQFAVYLGRKLAESGMGRVEIHAETSISLNARRSQPMVDPAVDLAATPGTWGHSPWIVPLEDRQPP